MLGYSSSVVNGQLINRAPSAGYDPLIFGQAYTGPAFWPRQGVYNVPPVLPSGPLQQSMAPASMGQYGSSPASPLPSAMSGSGNPYHPTKSPLWMALIFLAVGVLMLQHIHYR
jgi:hypothetical protein